MGEKKKERKKERLGKTQACSVGQDGGSLGWERRFYVPNTNIWL
jgi:hypothetical protein